MQYVTRAEFLELLGLTGSAFDQLQHAGRIALAFGTSMPATPGRYLDLDLVAMGINLGLTPGVGSERATAIVAACFHQWLSAVGHAEADPKQDYFMTIGGVGWDAANKSAKSLVVTNGTLGQIAEDFQSIPNLVGSVTVNISGIIRGLRTRAHTAGIDLSRPFFFLPDDPRFNEILTRVKRERDARIVRLKGDKKKLAAATAWRRRQDIVEALRPKDISQQLTMQLA